LAPTKDPDPKPQKTSPGSDRLRLRLRLRSFWRARSSYRLCISTSFVVLPSLVRSPRFVRRLPTCCCKLLQYCCLYWACYSPVVAQAKPNRIICTRLGRETRPLQQGFLSLIPFSLTWNSLVPSGSVHTQFSSVRFRQVKSVQCSTLRNGTWYDRLSPVYCPTPAPGHSQTLYLGAFPIITNSFQSWLPTLLFYFYS